jgi:hypothetical protein
MNISAANARNKAHVSPLRFQFGNALFECGVFGLQVFVLHTKFRLGGNQQRIVLFKFGLSSKRIGKLLMDVKGDFPHVGCSFLLWLTEGSADVGPLKA